MVVIEAAIVNWVERDQVLSKITENMVAIRRNLRHLRYFGPSYLKRFMGDRHAIQSSHVKGYGKIYYRYDAADQEVCEQIFDQRQYDLSEFSAANQRITQFYQAILAEGRKPVIIDVGANIGISAIWFHKLYPEAQIICVEPDPGNAKVLRKNIAGYDNISFYEAAISAQPGHVAMVEGLKGWSAQTINSEKGAATIASMSIEQLLENMENAELLIVKIDIEGYEENLFAANLDWIDLSKVVIVEPHDWKFTGKFTSHKNSPAIICKKLWVRGDLSYLSRAKI